MITLKKIDITDPSYYFFSEITNIKNFEPNLLIIDKISFIDTDGFTYYIKYITMKKSWSCNY